MTAGAAAAAMESARIVSESARREREAEKEKQAAADAALAELTAGKKDFGAMMKALAAQRKAGLLEEEGPPGLEALLKPRDDGDYAGEVVGPSGKVYRSTSIFCLNVWMEPRRTAIFVIESRPFDPIILVTILCNCATMAWESPLDPCCTWKAAFIDKCEWTYLFIFTFELVMKILAYGFLMHEGSYLRDAWCQLDFVVVTLAWIPILVPSFGNYSVIRSVRALRPLRALKRVPGMPVLVSSILAVLPKMVNVASLCLFIFLVFGIVGMELFKGALHYRCALPGFKETPGHPVSELRRLLEMSTSEMPTFEMPTSGVAASGLGPSHAEMRAAIGHLGHGAHHSSSSSGGGGSGPASLGLIEWGEGGGGGAAGGSLGAMAAAAALAAAPALAAAAGGAAAAAAQSAAGLAARAGVAQVGRAHQQPQLLTAPSGLDQPRATPLDAFEGEEEASAVRRRRLKGGSGGATMSHNNPDAAFETGIQCNPKVGMGMGRGPWAWGWGWAWARGRGHGDGPLGMGMGS